MSAATTPLVGRSPTRAQCRQSIEMALRAGAIAPAVLAGLLLAMDDDVVAFAKDDAVDLGRRFGGMGPTIERLEMIAAEEERKDSTR